MKKNEIVIEVCIPHRMPAKAYIFADREDFKDAMIERARQSDNYRWAEWTLEEAKAQYGENDIPPLLLAALEKNGGRVVERGFDYLAEKDAGNEVDYATDFNGMDYHGHLILGGDEAIAYVLSGPEGHQKPRARRLVKELLLAEIDRSELPADWIVKDEEESED